MGLGYYAALPAGTGHFKLGRAKNDVTMVHSVPPKLRQLVFNRVSSLIRLVVMKGSFSSVKYRCDISGSETFYILRDLDAAYIRLVTLLLLMA